MASFLAERNWKFATVNLDSDKKTEKNHKVRNSIIFRVKLNKINFYFESEKYLLLVKVKYIFLNVDLKAL